MSLGTSVNKTIWLIPLYRDAHVTAAACTGNAPYARLTKLLTVIASEYVRCLGVLNNLGTWIVT